MPCSDGGPSQQDIELEHHRQRGLAVGLCIACAELDSHDLLPDCLADWYRAHRAADAARDASQKASLEFSAIEAAARRNGFNGLVPDHPARKASQQAYNERWTTEARERAESAKLSRLKPE